MINSLPFFVYLLITLAGLFSLGSCIGCYVCSSLSGSDLNCEDPFNTSVNNNSYYVDNCYGYRKERTGVFPADHCIKVSGVSNKNSNHTIMIRTCALDSGTLTADTELVRMSHCGHFIFDNVYFSGCVQSCAKDGCNNALSISIILGSWKVICHVLFISSVAIFSYDGRFIF